MSKRSEPNKSNRYETLETGKGRVYRGRPEFSKERKGFVSGASQAVRDDPNERGDVYSMEPDANNQESNQQVFGFCFDVYPEFFCSHNHQAE